MHPAFGSLILAMPFLQSIARRSCRKAAKGLVLESRLYWDRKLPAKDLHDCPANLHPALATEYGPCSKSLRGAEPILECLSHHP